MIGSKFSIGRLRVYGSQETGPAVRLRLAHQLNTADLHPTGLPPPAILMVRRLNDPLPGRIVSTRPVVRVDTAWETAVRRSLEKSYRQAARPQQGLILGEPEAVVFQDEAEILACLLVIQLRSLSPATWWFRTLVNRLGPTRSLVGQLMERPELVPAVFGYLTAWHKAGDVLLKFSLQQSHDLLIAVIKQYQLPALLPPEPTISQMVSSPDRPYVWESSQPLQIEYPQSPWASLLSGQIPNELVPDQQALLGFCLLLQLRPALVRHPSFQREWQQWWHSVDNLSLIPSTQPGIPISTITTPNQVAKSSDLISPALDEISTALTDFHEPDKKSFAKNLKTKVEDGAITTKSFDAELAQSPNIPLSNEDKDVFQPSNPWMTKAKTSTPARQIDIFLQQPNTFVSPDSGVKTAVGGVLYLINLMKMLDLPTACEPGWGLASQVSAWGVLELLGRSLLGITGAGYDADPLWRVLSELDGRDGGTLPGEDYEIVGECSFPTGWAVVQETSFSPRDYPLLYGMNANLQRWLELVLPFINRRLRHLLDLQDADDMARILFLVAGRLFITRSHMDLVMDLNTISLPVRRAGMDANPGWLPTFGRVITFHFL